MTHSPAHAPALDYTVRNRGFCYVAKAWTPAAQSALAEFRPDLPRERDGRLGLSADELSEFERWASARGLSHHLYMSE